MIGGLLLFLALSAGFGLPFTVLGLGGALAFGASLTVLTLFCATVFAGLAVSTAAWVTCGLALVTGGIGWLFYRPRPTNAWLNHPALWLPLMVVATGVVVGTPHYLPVNWDEMSGWASWTRQIMAADVSWRADMLNSYPGYIKGWPVLAAAMTRVLGSTNLSVGIGVLTAWHCLVLASVYDMTTHILRRRNAFTDSVRQAMAWVFLLVLILGEASWKLVPHSYLIEQPQLYPAIAFLCFGALAVSAPAASKIRFLALAAAGLTLATAYTIKPPMMALSFGALFFLKGTPTGYRRVAAAGLLFAPLLLVMVGWSFALPAQASHGMALSSMVTSMQDRGAAILPRLMTQFTAYFLSWKVPMTAFGIVGLILSLRLRGQTSADQKAVALCLATYAFVTWIGLLPLYMYVIIPWSNELPSLPRYMGIPLRLIHLFGGLFIAIEVSVWASTYPMVRRWTEGGALSWAISVLIGLQVAMTGRAITSLFLHPDIGRDAYAQVIRVHDSVPLIHQTVIKSAIPDPEIAVLDQGGDGYASVILNYYSIRAPGNPSASVHYFHLAKDWSFGPAPLNIWMRAADASTFRQTLSQSPILWINRPDSWSLAALSPLVGDCSGDLSGQVLLRNARGTYDCQQLDAASFHGPTTPTQ